MIAGRGSRSARPGVCRREKADQQRAHDQPRDVILQRHGAVAPMPVALHRGGERLQHGIVKRGHEHPPPAPRPSAAGAAPRRARGKAHWSAPRARRAEWPAAPRRGPARSGPCRRRRRRESRSAPRAFPPRATGRGRAAPSAARPPAPHCRAAAQVRVGEGEQDEKGIARAQAERDERVQPAGSGHAAMVAGPMRPKVKISPQANQKRNAPSRIFSSSVQRFMRDSRCDQVGDHLAAEQHERNAAARDASCRRRSRRCDAPDRAAADAAARRGSSARPSRKARHDARDRGAQNRSA